MVSEGTTAGRRGRYAAIRWRVRKKDGGCRRAGWHFPNGGGPPRPDLCAASRRTVTRIVANIPVAAPLALERNHPSPPRADRPSHAWPTGRAPHGSLGAARPPP